MRKLKLQMQITVDGFVAGPEGQLDWMTWEMDEKLIAFINHLTDTSDTILLGRKMTEGFIKYWEGVVANPSSPEHAFGRKMVDTPKIVFSKTLSRIEGRRRLWRRDLRLVPDRERADRRAESLRQSRGHRQGDAHLRGPPAAAPDLLDGLPVRHRGRYLRAAIGRWRGDLSSSP